MDKNSLELKLEDQKRNEDMDKLLDHYFSSPAKIVRYKVTYPFECAGLCSVSDFLSRNIRRNLIYGEIHLTYRLMDERL